jgi:hypothetical protein
MNTPEKRLTKSEIWNKPFSPLDCLDNYSIKQEGFTRPRIQSKLLDPKACI